MGRKVAMPGSDTSAGELACHSLFKSVATLAARVVLPVAGTYKHAPILIRCNTAVPEPGMPLTATINLLLLGVVWNLSHVFFTNLSTCSSMLETCRSAE